METWVASFNGVLAVKEEDFMLTIKNYLWNSYRDNAVVNRVGNSRAGEPSGNSEEVEA